MRHSNNKWHSFPSIRPPLLRQCHTHRPHPTMPSPSNRSQHTPRSRHPHQRRSQPTCPSIRQRIIKIITTMGGGDVEDEPEEEDVVEDGDVERAPPTRTLPHYHRKLRHTRQRRMEQFLPHLFNVQHIPTLQNTSTIGIYVAHADGTSPIGTPANRAHTKHPTRSTTTVSQGQMPSSTLRRDGTF